MAQLTSIGGVHYEMMKRCYNEKSVMYSYYGAKGIKVCDEWHDREVFKRWVYANGWNPELRLELIDPKGNYEPSNCRFGTKRRKVLNSPAQKQKEYHKERMRLKEEAGITGNMDKDELYGTYTSMHTRCENSKHIKYKDYGGRGITVCDEWSGKQGFFNFKKWAMENGWQKGLTIDRIDNNGNYTPINCRWATQKEQIMNRRCSKAVEYNGKKMSLTDIAKLNNTTYRKLYDRVVLKNMSVDEALNDIKLKK
jgi:hypothetical protein